MAKLKDKLTKKNLILAIVVIGALILIAGLGTDAYKAVVN